jgi:hypothetical protein
VDKAASRAAFPSLSLAALAGLAREGFGPWLRNVTAGPNQVLQRTAWPGVLTSTPRDKMVISEQICVEIGLDWRAANNQALMNQPSNRDR